MAEIITEGRLHEALAINLNLNHRPLNIGNAASKNIGDGIHIVSSMQHKHQSVMMGVFHQRLISAWLTINNLDMRLKLHRYSSAPL